MRDDTTALGIVDAAPLVQQGSPIELAAAAWLHSKTGKSNSEKTARAYRDALGSFRAYLRALGLDLDSEARAVRLAAQDWAGKPDDRKGRGRPVSPSTFNQRLAILSSFYVYACKAELLPCENPIAAVERRTVDQYGTARALDYADLKQWLAQIDRAYLDGQRDYALLAVLLHTGRRVAEVAAMRWANVETNGERVTLHFPRTKGGKSASDALPAPVARALLVYLHNLYGPQLGGLAPDAPIWVSFSPNAKDTRPALGAQGIADICARRLGVSKVHTLRHTFAKAMEDAGAKVSDIQARLGHSSLATTGRYLAALKKAENPYGDALADLFGVA